MPLGLEGLYTYSVPQSMENEVQSFVRVQVPLGSTKTYTALVVRIHENEPIGVKVKDIINVIDKSPVLLPNQYKLWQWIADYYMSPIGDVYRAALPSGMKVEDRYHVKTDTFIGLKKEFQSEMALHMALNSLVRAPKQLEAFNHFLEMTGWDSAFSDTQPCLEGNNSCISDSRPCLKGNNSCISDSRPCLEGNTERSESNLGQRPRTSAEQNSSACKAVPIQPLTREALMNASHSNINIIKALCDRGLLYTYEKEVGRLNYAGEPHPENIKQLNEYQQEAYDNIYKQWEKHNVCLLHGVTSSGKTEIYISMIQKAIDEGKQVLYLLPEIALTVQITQRLQRVFGNRIGIYHSKYSDAERVEIWQKQLSTEPYDIILGARSAVFLPFQRLGLVVIDEEHETSFKQQDPAPRYHGRSVAIVLSQMYGAKTLLGTATPSMESYYNAMQGKYGLVTLNKRYKELQLPEIKVIDTKDLRHRKIMRGVLSPDLNIAISNALKAGEQVILFQNRRGFSPVIECHECGWSPKCPNCDVSLTYHKNMNSLTCHYCGYTYKMPTECPDCHNKELKDRGFGTEKIEDIIEDEFPQARIARMDLDTTRTRNAYERIISDFSSHKTNILIGTQMVTKGLDFDHVSVVGILNADSMLNQPDFRAWEHAFMMMTQVAGRAGRKGRKGLVILQTNNPVLPVIKQVVENDYKGFFHNLLEERKDFRYPPFTRLIYIYLKHRDNNVVDSAGIELASRLRQTMRERVLGPDKPAVARVKTLFIRKIMLKLENSLFLQQVHNVIKTNVSLLMQDKRYKSLQLYFDVDPV